MTYELVFSDDAVNALEKMDSKTSDKIVPQVEKNLYRCKNTSTQAKPSKEDSQECGATG